MMTGCIVGTFLAAAAATPLPVQIVGGENPDPFFTYTLPILGAIVGLLGLLVSMVAIFLIWLQIKRADMSIAKADEQIEWAKRDFEFTQRSVTLSENALTIARETAERDAAERAKSPLLALKFTMDDAGHRKNAVGNTLTHWSDSAPIRFAVNIFVANSGQRDATTVLVRLMLSDGLTFRQHYLQTMSLLREATATDATYVLENDVLTNNGVFVFAGKSALTAMTWGEYDLYYRIESNEGVWPHNADASVEQRGRLHIILTSDLLLR